MRVSMQAARAVVFSDQRYLWQKTYPCPWGKSWDKGLKSRKEDRSWLSSADPTELRKQQMGRNSCTAIQDPKDNSHYSKV